MTKPQKSLCFLGFFLYEAARDDVPCFFSITVQYLSMSNEQFEDMAVLATYAQLRAGKLLNEADVQALKRELKSAWGRKVFAVLLRGKAPAETDRALLQRFSTVFES